MNNLADIRKTYMKGSISLSEMPNEPFTAFQKWMSEAIASEVHEPTAFTLSTKGAEFPDSRVVLLKDFSENGLVFFTNYLSQKGQQIAQNPHVAVNFFWPELERQVRILGIAEKISPEESDKYFYSRPIESQAGAIISQQSSTIDPQRDLEVETQELLKQPANIKRPPHWGGINIKPIQFEFWQGRPSRVHDRIRYKLSQTDWLRERLAP
jgi:pyridoxamine 5'-phosphate oxidase